MPGQLFARIGSILLREIEWLKFFGQGQIETVTHTYFALQWAKYIPPLCIIGDLWLWNTKICVVLRVSFVFSNVWNAQATTSTLVRVDYIGLNNKCIFHSASRNILAKQWAKKYFCRDLRERRPMGLWAWESYRSGRVCV